MITLSWLTDIHLNFINDESVEHLVDEISDSRCDAVVITGDISEADKLIKHMNYFRVLNKSVYWVAGNHDFYHGSVESVREEIRKEFLGSNIKYLTQEGPVKLTDDSVLIGDDGWYDGRNGKYYSSFVELSDFFLIKDFKGKTFHGRLEVMQQLARESSDRIRKKCDTALSQSGIKHLYIATHIAPFAGSAWHLGKPSNDEWQPFFSSRVMGETIIDSTAEFRNNGGHVTVLCGHSHSEGVFQASNNLVCLTGSAEYGKPKIYRYLDVK